MIGSVSANRRANAFAQLVAESRPGEPRPGDEAAVADPPVAGPRAPADGAEQAVLLSVVERLADLPRPELGAETRASQRALLIATMEAAAAAAPDGLTEAPRAVTACPSSAASAAARAPTARSRSAGWPGFGPGRG